MKPSRQIATFSGAEAEEVNVSPQYTRTQATFIGPTTGIVTVRVKEDGSTRFNEIVNGALDLSCQDTIMIDGPIIKAIEITIFPTAAYTVKITQFKPIGVY